MDPLTKWAAIMGIVSGIIAVILFVFRFVAFIEWMVQLRRSIARSLYRLWSSSIGKLAFTVVVILLIVVIIAGVQYVSTKTSHSIIATSAPQTAAILPVQSYSTLMPGPRCDKRAGQWKADSHLALTCLNNNVDLISTGDSSEFNELYFLGSDKYHTLFSDSYTVHVEITFPAHSDAYIGLGVHGIKDKSICGQIGWIAADGLWEVYRYRPDGNVDWMLDRGSVPANAPTYTLDITVNGPDVDYVINGATVSQTTDTTYQNTSYVCIGIGGSPNNIVTLSNFDFTPAT